MLYNMCHVMLYNMDHVMLYNISHVMLYNMGHIVLYNMGQVMLYNMCHLVTWHMLYNITCPMLCYIAFVMLCYITCIMLCYITCYKIAKIVRALWLAERGVCMRVCKHGCGVKMFCFSRANHASTNLKTFSSKKLDKLTLSTHSFVGWNLENRYKEGVSIFIRLSWHFKGEKSVFWKASFCKTRTDYARKASWTRLCDW